MNWQDALDYQADLFRFWGSEMGAKYSKQFGESVLDKNSVGQSATGATAMLLDRGGNNFDPGRIAYMGRWSAFTAEPIAVDPDIQTIIEEAAKLFKPEKLVPEDLLTPSGFVLFPRPYYVMDGQGKRVANRAISWAPCQSPNQQQQGVLIMLYSHTDDEDDYAPAGTLPVIGGCKLSLNHIAPWWFNDSIPNAITKEDLTPHYQERDLDVMMEAMLAPLRLFQVFNRIASQRLAQATQMQPQRQYRKRAQRAGLTETPYITVITLRRPRKARDEDAEPQEVEWTHRWIVGLHWRNQWYPSLKMHRQILIAPYVKGPEDKELKIRDKRAFNFIK